MKRLVALLQHQSTKLTNPALRTIGITADYNSTSFIIAYFLCYRNQAINCCLCTLSCAFLCESVCQATLSLAMRTRRKLCLMPTHCPHLDCCCHMKKHPFARRRRGPCPTSLQVSINCGHRCGHSLASESVSRLDAHVSQPAYMCLFAGSSRHIQCFLDSGLLPRVVEVMKQDEWKVRTEAAWCITNITTGGTDHQLQAAVDQVRSCRALVLARVYMLQLQRCTKHPAVMHLRRGL